MRKVNLNVIRPWIAKKVVELVGFEDEVVVEYAMGLLEDKSQFVCLLLVSSVMDAYSFCISTCDCSSRIPRRCKSI